MHPHRALARPTQFPNARRLCAVAKFSGRLSALSRLPVRGVPFRCPPSGSLLVGSTTRRLGPFVRSQTTRGFSADFRQGFSRRRPSSNPPFGLARVRLHPAPNREFNSFPVIDRLLAKAPLKQVRRAIFRRLRAAIRARMIDWREGVERDGEGNHDATARAASGSTSFAAA